MRAASASAAAAELDGRLGLLSLLRGATAHAEWEGPPPMQAFRSVRDVFGEALEHIYEYIGVKVCMYMYMYAYVYMYVCVEKVREWEGPPPMQAFRELTRYLSIFICMFVYIYRGDAGVSQRAGRVRRGAGAHLRVYWS